MLHLKNYLNKSVSQYFFKDQCVLLLEIILQKREVWISPLKRRGKGLLFINVTLLLSQDVKIRYSSKKKLHDWQRKKCMSGLDSVYSVIDWMIVNNIPALTQVNTSSEMSFRGSYFDKRLR